MKRVVRIVLGNALKLPFLRPDRRIHDLPEGPKTDREMKELVDVDLENEMTDWDADLDLDPDLGTDTDVIEMLVTKEEMIIEGDR